MRIPADPPPPVPQSGEMSDQPANLSADNNRFDEAVQDALDSFCNSQEQSYDDFLHRFSQITAADVTPPWNRDVEVAPPLLSEPRVAPPSVSILQSARNTMIERLLRLSSADHMRVASCTDHVAPGGSDAAVPPSGAPSQQTAAEPADGIEEISSEIGSLVGSLLSPDSLSGSRTGRLVQFDNFVDDEGSADDGDHENEEPAAAGRQPGEVELTSNTDASATTDEFAAMAPYQASFAAPTEGRSGGSVEPAATTLDNRTLDTFLSWPVGARSKSEKNANNQLQKISDIVTENLPSVGFTDSLEDDMLHLSNSASSVNHLYPDSATVIDNSLCTTGHPSHATSHHGPGSSTQNVPDSNLTTASTSDKNSKSKVAQTDCIAQTLIQSLMRHRTDAEDEEGLLDLIRNNDSDSDSELEYDPAMDRPNPGEIEDDKDGMSEKAINDMKNIRRLDFSGRYRQEEEATSAENGLSNESTRVTSSEPERNQSSTDCIEPFSLDQNFDYDNVVLSSKFTPAETEFLQSLSSRRPVQPPYAPGFDPNAENSDSD